MPFMVYIVKISMHDIYIYIYLIVSQPLSKLRDIFDLFTISCILEGFGIPKDANHFNSCLIEINDTKFPSVLMEWISKCFVSDNLFFPCFTS